MHTKQLKQMLDFNLFESPWINMNCANSKQQNSIISHCKALQRLSFGLLYDNENLFCNNDSFYKPYSLLNDWNHFIKQHTSNQQLIQIADELRNKYDVKTCNIRQCNKMRRHYSRQLQKNDTTEMCSFYVDCFDRFHHQIFHLFEIGLRVKSTEKDLKWQCENCTFINTVESQLTSINECVVCGQNTYIDNYKLFEKRKNEIKTLRKQFTNCNLPKYNQNNKFNMVIHEFNDANYNKSESVKGNTFLDNMCEYIETQSGHKNISQIVAQLKHYINLNEYDSDAFKQDVHEIAQSNVNNDLNNHKTNANKFVFDSIKAFIRYIKLSATSFSTGQRFYYWPHYKANCLFVSPYYSSLREEILESGFLNKKQWNRKIAFKALQYYKTEKVKNITASQNVHTTKREIKNRQLISLQHLECVMLYCDWSDLCTHFSETFRKKYEFAPVDLLKERHA
eukprot:78566_1